MTRSQIRYKYLVLCREQPYFAKGHSYCKSKYTKADSSRCSSLSRQHFPGICRKYFPKSTCSRHSNGHKLCRTLSQHFSLLKRSSIHTVCSWHVSFLHLVDTFHQRNLLDDMLRVFNGHKFRFMHLYEYTLHIHLLKYSTSGFISTSKLPALNSFL